MGLPALYNLGMGVTLQERADSYAQAFPRYPPLVVSPDGRWLYGSWKFGNNYRGSGLYGAYPPDYLERLRAVFPDAVGARVLHIFSGSIGPTNPLPGVRVDIRLLIDEIGVGPLAAPDVVGDAHRLPFHDGAFEFVFADTPYSARHAEHYGTKMVDRRLVLRELARVARTGGHLVWLDTKMPMFRKTDWHEWGNIGCWRSTNHDIRGVTCFQRA